MFFFLSRPVVRGPAHVVSRESLGRRPLQDDARDHARLIPGRQGIRAGEERTIIFFALYYRACHHERQCITVPHLISLFWENGCLLPFIVTFAHSSARPGLLRVLRGAGVPRARGRVVQDVRQQQGKPGHGHLHGDDEEQHLRGGGEK